MGWLSSSRSSLLPPVPSSKCLCDRKGRIVHPGAIGVLPSPLVPVDVPATLVPRLPDMLAALDADDPDMADPGLPPGNSSRDGMSSPLARRGGVGLLACCPDCGYARSSSCPLAPTNWSPDEPAAWKLAADLGPALDQSNPARISALLRFLGYWDSAERRGVVSGGRAPCREPPEGFFLNLRTWTGPQLLQSQFG